jgi:hypothetical protein
MQERKFELLVTFGTDAACPEMQSAPFSSFRVRMERARDAEIKIFERKT